MSNFSSSSLFGALTPSPPKTKREHHIVQGQIEEVTAREQQSHRHMERDDFPSSGDNDVYRIRSSAGVDHPRVSHSTLFGPSGPRDEVQLGMGDYDYSLASRTPSENVHALEETQNNSLCDRLHDFHFETQLNEGHILPEQRRAANMSQTAASSPDASSSHTALYPLLDYPGSCFQSPSAIGFQVSDDTVFIPEHEQVSSLSSGYVHHAVSTQGASRARTSPSQSYPPPRSTHNEHGTTFQLTRGYVVSSGRNTTVTDTESDAVQDQGVQIQTIGQYDDRDHASAQSQSPSFLQHQYRPQPSHSSRQLPSRNSSDRSSLPMHMPGFSTLQPLGGNTIPITNRGPFPVPYPIPTSAPGPSATGFSNCPSTTSLHPHSAPPMLHEWSSASLLGDTRLAASQGNTVSPGSFGSSQPSCAYRYDASIGHEGESLTSDHMGGTEMRTEGWCPIPMQLDPSSARLIADSFGPSLLPSTSPMQSPSSSPTTYSSSRHLRRWSSATASSSVPLRSPPTFSGGNLYQATRHRRHSQADTTEFIQRSPRKASSQSRSPTPGLGQASAQIALMLHPVPDDAEPSVSTASASTSVNAMSQERHVVMCGGHLVDDDAVHNALQRPDKLLHVYECFWDRENTPCGMWVEGDQPSIADHLHLFHGFRGGETTTRCLWGDCPKPNMKGTSIARHVVTHVGFRIKCDTCKHDFARGDACNRAHTRSHCMGVGQPMYGDLVRVLDARKVEPGYRLVKKRRLEDS
ncbi:hypothetical protein V8B97DRAFT_805757 [Scleroderma yunnanense]